MDPKLLTESGWKSIASLFKLKDNGLLRALSDYEKLADTKHAEQIAALNAVSGLARALKKDSLVSLIPRATNYLTEMITAAGNEASRISKSKAVVDKKAELDAKAEEKEAGDYVSKLLSAFQKLKSSDGLNYEFIVCDAAPHCGVMVAKRITAQHKEELTRLTGGSKRFTHIGSCSFVDGKFNFNLGQPMTGLAKKLQKSIQFFTGRKLPIMVGNEAGDEDS